MPSWLQHLRSKSPQTRHRVALGTSVGVTCLIFVMWVTVLNFGTVEPTESLQATADNTTQTASPLSAFGANAASAFRQLKAGFSSTEEGERASSSEETANSDNFWADTSQSQSASAHQTIPEDIEEPKDAEDTESFTSRNYNPSQEGEWFTQD